MINAYAVYAGEVTGRIIMWRDEEFSKNEIGRGLFDVMRFTERGW